MKTPFNKTFISDVISTKALILAVILCLTSFATTQKGFSAEASGIDDLLDLVREGMSKDAQEQRERLAQFKNEVKKQDDMIKQAQEEKRNLEKTSEMLEIEFAKNEKELAKQQEQLTARMGNLKEMFGVLQQVAGDTKGIFESSLISAKYPGRQVFLDTLISKSASTSELPSMEDLEKLWFELHQQVTQSGKIEKYQASVTNTQGEKVQQEIMQVGGFNAISNNGYLIWNAETQSLVELAKQPASYMSGSADDLLEAKPGEQIGFWLDPSRGALLSILLKTPGLGERIQQGGTVGYIIIALGFIALLIAIERMVKLASVSRGVKTQIESTQARDDNPLGRIMNTYQIEKNADVDIESLELSVSEAIAKELPGITRFISWLKIIAAIAPLLGLLGTVTGMINTFEVMSLFGTGDPKLMAGGISQALVTTVLGLAIAIPAVLLHTLVNERAKGIIQVLEEKALGMMAQSAEAQAQKNQAQAA